MDGSRTGGSPLTKAVAGRAHERGILGLGNAGDGETLFTGGKKERFSLEGRVEVDPLVFDLPHGDGWPISFRASEKGGLAPSAGRQRSKHSPVAVQAKLALGDAAGGLDGDIDATVEELQNLLDQELLLEVDVAH
eukprot:gene39316-51814_t